MITYDMTIESEITLPPLLRINFDEKREVKNYNGSEFTYEEHINTDTWQENKICISCKDMFWHEDENIEVCGKCNPPETKIFLKNLENVHFSANYLNEDKDLLNSSLYVEINASDLNIKLEKREGKLFLVINGEQKEKHPNETNT